MTKTAIIYNLVPEEIEYHIVDGDYSHLQGAYVNFENTPEEEELCHLLYPEESPRPDPVSLEELKQAVLDGAHLIEAGFVL